MLEEVVIGALANLVSDVLSATARQLGAVRRAFGERRHSADLELATYFDTYTFVQDAAPGLARRLEVAVGAVEVDAFAQRIASDRCHAVLHELLAARLTHAPEQQLGRLRDAFSRAVGPLGVLGSEPADAAFEYLDDKLCQAVARLESALPDAARRLRDRAIGHRIIAILDAIERHQATLAEDADPGTDLEQLQRYRRHLVEEFGVLAPPDVERRRRISLQELYVAPKVVPIPSDTADRHASPAIAQPLLTEFAAGIDRTVLLGDPGAGKTTAARALVHTLARDATVVPFLVTLRDFAADGTATGSVAQHIEDVMNIVFQCPPPPGWVRRRLLDGNSLVIFDGLDELVDATRRAQISSIIEHFCIEYPLTRVLVTSRFVGYEQARLNEREFIRHRIDRFDEEQVAEYARKWFASERALTQEQAARDAEAFIAESASVPDLRSNPLMLSLMCVLYRGEGYLPQHRAQVYRMSAELLFHHWDASRHIQVALTLDLWQVQRLLRALAYWLLTRTDEGTAVTERQLVAKTTELLLARDMEQPAQARSAAEQFVAFCRGRGWVLVDVGTTAAGESMYSFAHRTFLEYFAAAQVAADADTPEALARICLQHLARSEWDVVIQLAIAMKDEAISGGGQRTLQGLFKDRRYTSSEARRNLVHLASSCLDSVDLTPDYVRVLTRRALDFLLDHGNDSEDRAAVLAWSRLNVRRRQDLVADEYKARAETLIASDDPWVRTVGCFLGAWYPYGVSAEVMHAGSEYWRIWASENARTWRDTIIGDAQTMLTSLHLAVEQGLLTVREVLAQPDGLTRLTSPYPNPLVGFPHGSWLGFRGYEMRMYRAHERRRWATTFEQLGAHLLEDNPAPPFTAHIWGPHPAEGYLGTELAADERITESAYLSTAVITAADLESRVRREPPAVVAALISARPTGWLSELAPYLRERLGINGGPLLAPLPVREDYQRLFKEWAHRKVDFARPPDTAGDLAHVMG
ncbi:MAG: NACHT domain-containing protein [Catenulispora sp.]|nr:NACHT domain-containing protein [Catenulispora sp.]